MSGTPEVETLSSRTVYRNRWLAVREDAIRRGDGREGLYSVIEKPDFAVVVPVEPDGSVHLVEQYRYPVGSRQWELPQGVSAAANGDPLATAHAELAEETGLTAARMTDYGRLFLAYGFTAQAYTVFVAEGLSAGPAALDPEEHGLISRRFAWDEVSRMLADGTIMDGVTHAVFGLLAVKGWRPPGIYSRRASSTSITGTPSRIG